MIAAIVVATQPSSAAAAATAAASKGAIGCGKKLNQAAGCAGGTTPTYASAVWWFKNIRAEFSGAVIQSAIPPADKCPPIDSITKDKADAPGQPGVKYVSVKVTEKAPHYQTATISGWYCSLKDAINICDVVPDDKALGLCQCQDDGLQNDLD